MNNSIKLCGYLFFASVAIELSWKIYEWASKKCAANNRKHRSISLRENESRKILLQDTEAAPLTDVLFFPDKEVACKYFFLKPNGCNNERCRYSHEKTSLSELYTYLNSAKTCIDVCVYTITCMELVEILLDKHSKGLLVRVITDDDQMKVSNAQIWKLREGGISVRTDNSSYYMHHKFVIVDKKMLLNGSFNWTRQAITGNQENLLITTEQYLVGKYSEEYSRLWSLFDPKAIYSSELHSS